jgi:hypothetical protein
MVGEGKGHYVVLCSLSGEASLVLVFYDSFLTRLRAYRRAVLQKEKGP